MKKCIIALLLALCTLLAACNRSDPDDKMISPFRFYYQPADPDADFGLGALWYELRETAGHEADIPWILAEYLQGPASPELLAPFRKTTVLNQWNLSNGQLSLVLSQDFAELSGIDLTVACACITQTCLGFENVESVSISASGSLLGSRSTITMSANNLLTIDLSADVVEHPYVLYFSDTANRYLVGETFILEGDKENVASLLLDRLISGPKGAGLAETIPVGTDVLSLGISDGVCSVNFSGEFLTYAPRSEYAQRLTILSITNTLTQLDDVDGVDFYVNGGSLQHYGIMDLTQLMTFEERAIGPARVGMNELDLDLYLCQQGRKSLVAIPIRIQQTPKEALCGKMVETLLSFEDQNGFHTPIPAGTELISALSEDDLCEINLSYAFLSGEETENAAAVICATILADTDCKAVRLLVEGEEYFVTQWKPEWVMESVTESN